jgi:hypothetical protein
MTSMPERGLTFYVIVFHKYNIKKLAVQWLKFS